MIGAGGVLSSILSPKPIAVIKLSLVGPAIARKSIPTTFHYSCKRRKYPPHCVRLTCRMFFLLTVRLPTSEP